MQLSSGQGRKAGSFPVITTRSRSSWESYCPRTSPGLASWLHPVGNGFANSTRSVGSVFNRFSKTHPSENIFRVTGFLLTSPGVCAKKGCHAHGSSPSPFSLFYYKKSESLSHTLSQQTHRQKGQGKSNRRGKWSSLPRCLYPRGRDNRLLPEGSRR